jgi:hypothetical protein
MKLFLVLAIYSLLVCVKGQKPSFLSASVTLDHRYIYVHGGAIALPPIFPTYPDLFPLMYQDVTNEFHVYDPQSGIYINSEI